MTKMKNLKNGVILNITEHIILKNFWEYYVTDDKTEDNDIINCLILGYETEQGDVYLPEIKPYIISRTKNLKEVAPAPNWIWIK